MMGVFLNMKNLRKEVKNGTTLHLTAKKKERGKENVTETVNDTVGGLGRPCCLLRGPHPRQSEGSLGFLLLGLCRVK